MQEITGTDVPTNALYDVQIKRIHEYKRQHLNMFSVISRYLDIKKMSKEERSQASVPLSFACMCDAQLPWHITLLSDSLAVQISMQLLEWVLNVLYRHRGHE